MRADLRYKLFSIYEKSDFPGVAMEVFDYQYNNNNIYREFVNTLGINHKQVSDIAQIPFLPVEFFRNHRIVTGNSPFEMIFESSGTTGVQTAKHFITDLSLYEESFLKTFRLFYGDPEDYLIIALLPSYTEKENSSLVYMADKLIRKSHHPLSGFYKNNIDEMLGILRISKEQKQKILLLGVSFALLDLAEKYSPDLSSIIVMETGGMKGRRKELTRAELHTVLKDKFNISSVHSEYGMTELLSQAYSKGDGIFYCPPWMKVVIRDPQDPMALFPGYGRTGGINLIDLANINSCSFIATSDLGRVYDDGGFDILGRFDNSDIRGCNLLTE